MDKNKLSIESDWLDGYIGAVFDRWGNYCIGGVVDVLIIPTTLAIPEDDPQAPYAIYVYMLKK